MAQFHVSRHYTESLAPHTSSVGVSNTAAGRRAWLARPYWKAIQYGSLSLRRQVDRGVARLPWYTGPFVPVPALIGVATAAIRG
jgi:hypothetical protein